MDNNKTEKNAGWPKTFMKINHLIKIPIKEEMFNEATTPAAKEKIVPQKRINVDKYTGYNDNLYV